MSATPGSAWVEGTDLHFIDGGGTEYAYTGEVIQSSVSGAVNSSIWLDTDDGQVHYIDESGDERAAPRVVGSSVQDAVSGSIWIENGLITYIDSGNNKISSHEDVSHDNVSHDNKSFSNGSFGNDSHDDHDDVVDSHEDGTETGLPGPEHGDDPHDDHGNSSFHGDKSFADHDDHADKAFDDVHDNKAFSNGSFGNDSHDDSAHQDTTFQDEPSAV